MIAVCTPSRGLIYSKTVESIFNGIQELNKHGLPAKLYTSHDLKIPDGHNFCVAQGMQDGATSFLFIEEDMYVFPDGFMALVSSYADISTMQYNDKNGSPHGIIHYNEQGELLWGGLGATLARRYVFEKLGEPYFRIDNLYKNIKKSTKMIDGKIVHVTDYERIEPRREWSYEEKKIVEKKDEYKYGGLDIDFYTRAREIGFKVEVLKDQKAHHFDLISFGEKHTNNGCHVIRQV